MNQTIQALAEADAYNGPALVIAYSHCIAHGIDMSKGMGEAKRAVQAGRWILYRFNPEARYEGKNPLHVDSPLGAPTLPLADYMSGENRFKGLMRDNPELAKELIKRAESEYAWRRDLYKQLAAIQPAEKVVK